MSAIEKKTNPLWTIIAFLVLGVLLAIGYKYKESLKPNGYTSAVVDESCDLRAGACTSYLPSGGKVSFSITPNDIKVLHPLTLQVVTEGIEATNVAVDFIGLGMDMGFNRVKLGKQDKNNFKGKATLPICTSATMNWEARVLLKTDKGLISAPFRFQTFK